MMYPKTPILDRIRTMQPQSQVVGEFIEWLTNEKSIRLCRAQRDPGPWDDIWLPIQQSNDSLLHEFFGINTDKEEKERQAVLAWIKQ